jgi:hypothetical protein
LGHQSLVVNNVVFRTRRSILFEGFFPVKRHWRCGSSSRPIYGSEAFIKVDRR